MSKKWYPVIDYSVCKECGVCISKCSHGVYDQRKAPAPKVVLPEGCIEGCHGCGNLCPTGAIRYVGENTGWTPPQGEKGNECGCDCSTGCGCS